MSSNFDIRIEKLTDIQYLSQQWQTLENNSNAPFFLTWYWIGAWLTLSPPRTYLLKLSAYDNGVLVALALLTKKNIKRRGVFRSRVLELHDYGLPNLNMVIEHNGILTARGYENKAPREILKSLVYEQESWDELKINGVNEDNQFIDKNLINELNLNIDISAASESRYVDLEKLRVKEIKYLSTLSRNTRYQIRRAIKNYNKKGNVTVSVAKNIPEALGYFDGLKVYHQSYWNRKGLSGCFANPYWIKFHTNIIEHAVDTGEVQLMRISAGERVIGYLYNLIRDGHVYMLQSGINYENDSSLHPGYVSHYMAIEYNLNAGHRIYDFLAGDARYKRSMSNNSVRLLWVILQKQRILLKTERFLKTIAIVILRKDRNVEF